MHETSSLLHCHVQLMLQVATYYTDYLTTDIPTLVIVDCKGDIVTTRGCNSVRSDPNGAVCHLVVCGLNFRVTC